MQTNFIPIEHEKTFTGYCFTWNNAYNFIPRHHPVGGVAVLLYLGVSRETFDFLLKIHVAFVKKSVI